MPGKKVEILILFILMIFSAVGAGAVVEANAVARQGGLHSPLTAKTFYDIGHELYTAKDANFLSARQAIIFFDAAVNLDSGTNYVLADIINIAWLYPEENFSDAVKLALNTYIDRSADLEVASKAVGYLLERLDSRERREELLTKLIYQFQQKNVMFSSDLSAQLGFLKAETADTAEAQKYLMQTFLSNKYNRLAFAKLAELAEAEKRQLPDIIYLQNLRFAVRANPLDIVSAARFAQYAEMLELYEPASEAYRYYADLFKYLNGQESVGPDIYRPWMLNCYNARQYSQCRKILKEIRDKGIFDVKVEAIASAAALQVDDKQNYKTIFDAIESRSNKILAGELKVSPAELEDFVWFFSFVADVNSEVLLTWATKAYDAEPNSVNAASLFAYALVINNQAELAAPLLEKIGTTTQAAGLAKAVVLLQNQDKTSATELLKKVVGTLPGSFEAQKAKAKLKELGSEYISVADSAALITALQNDFGQTIFSQFVEPQKMVSLQFNMKSSTFSYGSEITGNLVIMNNYSEPMVVCSEAMIKGNIRIDAQISGDLTEQIPALIVKTVRPSYEIKPGNALFIPLQLDTGRIKYILDCHPQAQLNLEYTAYVDPQTTPDGQIRNTLVIKPAHVILNRHRLELNMLYLQQRLDALKKGHQGQKAKSVQLFAGLLAEQQEFRQTEPTYRFLYAEPQLLSSALTRCLAEDDWILKVETIAAMQNLKLDYRLMEAVSGELDNPDWPVRLITVFILARSQDEKFLPVLSWITKNDPHHAVKELAAILSGNIIADSNDSNLQIEKEAGNVAVDSNDVNQPVEKEVGNVAPDTNDVNLPNSPPAG
jgi:hypothetical protein